MGYFFSFLLVSFVAFGQQPDITEFNQIHPLGVYFVNITPETRNEPKKSLSVTTTASNIFNPEVFFEHCTGPVCGRRPDFKFDIYTPSNPDAYKMYLADGVVHSLKLKFTQPLSSSVELQMGASMYQLSTGKAPWDVLFSDSFIEGFHKHIMRQDDPFGRKQRMLNQAYIWFYSYDNKTHTRDDYEVKENQVYFGTFDLSAIKFIKLVDKNNKVLATINLGLHTGVPMNTMHPYVPLGGSFNSTNTFKVGQKTSLTVAGGGSIMNNRVFKTAEPNQFLNDKDTQKITTAYNFTTSLNKETKGKFLSTGIAYQGRSRIMDGTDYRAREGQAFLMDTQYHHLKGIWQSVYSLTDSNEALTLFFSVTGKKSNRKYTFAIQEDGKYFTKWHEWQDDHHRFTPNPITGIGRGNNAPDVTWYFQVSQKFNWPKKKKAD